MSVQSVERAIHILQAIAAAPAGVSETARIVGLPKSTVARLLATLEAAEAVERSDDGQSYRVGPALRRLVSGSPTSDIVALAQPHLVHLARSTGEAAGLSVRRGPDAHYLAQVDSDNAVQVRDWTGASLPMHLVSAGLVMMAHLDEGLLSPILEGELERTTPNSVVDPAAIRRRLDLARADGYAWVVDELVEGLSSVAAPVFGRDRSVVAALHVHGPSFRFPGSTEPALIAERVTKAANALSESVRRAVD